MDLWETHRVVNRFYNSMPKVLRAIGQNSQGVKC